mgnify:FL=1
MKILKPSNTTHSITLSPRFKPSQTLSLFLKNKITGQTIIEDDASDLQGGLEMVLGVYGVPNNYTFQSGVLELYFDLDVLEGVQYSIEIKEINTVLYRGLAYCTEQEPQDYKLTKDKFTYV